MKSPPKTVPNLDSIIKVLLTSMYRMTNQERLKIIHAIQESICMKCGSVSACPCDKKVS
jgi:hypothetical protein